jgi:hypothetical protein
VLCCIIRLELQLEEWLTRADDIPDAFLSKLRDYSLDSWDHYTHLRIAYLLLTRYGRRDGMALIFRDIKAFIDNSPRTKRGVSMGTETRGTTFHETMTYFWTHMVHYAMESSRSSAGAMIAANGEAVEQVLSCRPTFRTISKSCCLDFAHSCG